MRTWQWAAVAGILVALYWGAEMTKALPRGIRNNNPGNIRLSNEKWVGQIDGEDEQFVTFSSPVWGIRALARLLHNYRWNYGLTTVRGLIDRWAPPVENDTSAYVNHVAKRLGVEPDEYINVDENLVALARAIAVHENGWNPYTEQLYREGVRRALS